MPSNSSYICIYHYNVKILKLVDPESLLINTKPMIKNKLKELQSELKRFKIQTVLVLDYKKRNNCKIFHSSAKPIASDSDNDQAFTSIMKKMKNYASKDWIFLYAIIKHSVSIFVC